MKKTLLLFLILCFLAISAMAVDVPFTNGILTVPGTMDTVAHWSMLKGDFGAGAGISVFSVTNVAIVDITTVGYQTRQTLGLDVLVPLSKLSKGPISLLWNELVDVDLGAYAGYGYQLNVQDTETELKWSGFDWGISIVKRF